MPGIMARAWSIDKPRRISIRAQGDLECIFAYILLRQGQTAADRFLKLARQAAEFLGRNPEAGPQPRWTTRHKRLRFWVISRTNYLIYYQTEDDVVSIERALDGRRDVARIIEIGVECGGVFGFDDHR